MYKLLGPHINHTLGGMPELVAAWQPPVAVILDHNPAWRWVRDAAPNTLLVGRHYDPNEPSPADPSFNPVQAARDQVARCLRAFNGIRYHYAIGYNEPTIGDPDGMKRLADFDAERARLLPRYGMAAALASLAVGNPPDMSLWRHYLPALEAGRQHGAVLALHQYNWPSMQTGDAEWYTLRHRKLYHGEPSHGWEGLPPHLHLPLLLTEIGLDKLAHRHPSERMPAGWNGHIEAAEYALQLDAYSRQLMRDRYVLGAAIYCLGALSVDWLLYEIWPHLARELAQNAHPLYRHTLPPAPDHALGIDVSWWQGKTFKWKAAKEQGISFAYIRASKRCDTDSTYARNHRRAGTHGILRGAYHYLYPEPNPRHQAQHFAATVQPSELPPALDVEEAGLTEWHVAQFLDEYHSMTSILPAIYTSQHKWHTLVGAGTAWAHNHPLWVADWGAGRETPRLPAPWARTASPGWEFWQYSNRGQVAGQRVDLNRYCGSEEELRAHYCL